MIFLVSLLGLLAAASAATSEVVLFVPPANYTDPRVLYARSVELRDGTLLATWENYSPEPPAVGFPIFRSRDGGASWARLSQIDDQANGWGLRYQPFLYELPADWAGYPAGTLVAAGNSIPTDLSRTKIDVYVSTDHGLSWKFASSVASGGRALPNNGETPVWEPFILLYQDQLVLYYSDQRDPKHGQKLVHQTTRDLATWDDPVDDVAHDRYTDRPGMTTVARLPDGTYLLAYEWGGGPRRSSGYGFPVHYRISDDPLRFAGKPDQSLVAAGLRPEGSPYVTWSSVGGKNGSIVASSSSNSQIFVNRALGDASAWVAYDVPAPAAYTRHLRVLDSNPATLLVMGAGHLPPSTTNRVTLSIVDLESLGG